MKLLLDTHTFLWWDSKSKQLSPRAFELIKPETNIVILSVVSIWEIQIKQQAGKLTLKTPLTETITTQVRENGFQLLSINLEHVFALEKLPLHHRDPFDRLLVAQAISEDAVLLSDGPSFSQYSVNVVWQNSSE